MKSVDKLFVAIKGAVMYDGKLLLLQESLNYKDAAQVGKWDMPGGRVTPGERWQDALKREINEETGLEVTIGRPFFIGEWWPRPRDEQWQVIATFVICEAKTSQLTLSGDHAAYKWVDPYQLDQTIDYAHCIDNAHGALQTLKL